MRDGFRNECRECEKVQARNWEARNPGKKSEYLARSHAKHKVKRNAKKKAYRKANLEKHQEWDRALYLRKREELRAQGKAYYEANKERFFEWRDKRRALLKGAEGQFTRDDVRRIYANQGGCCAYCGIFLPDAYHVDHKIPLSRGGNNWPDNLAITCATCNLRKQDKTPEEFVEVLLK